MLIFTLSGQQGGLHSFRFLEMPASARTTALGGSLITVQDEDVSLAFHNPAILQEMTDGNGTLNYDFRRTGIQNGTLNYGFHTEKLDLHWHAGLQYSNYGTFDMTDELGNIQGEFSAGDYALIVGASRKINDRFSVGINNKFIYSSLESYSATGLAWDIGGVYQWPEKQLSIGFVAKNIGFAMSLYDEQQLTMPLDLQFGISKQLKHLPFRYSFIFHNLQTWDLLYDLPPLTTFTDSRVPTAFSRFADNLFRHIIINGEFLFGKKENFRVRFAYNHQLKRELSVGTLRSLTGFSGGFEFKIKKFSLGYGFVLTHLDGMTSHISLRSRFRQAKAK